MHRNLVARVEDAYVIHEVLRLTAYQQLAARACKILEGLSVKWTLHTELATSEPCQTPGIRSLLQRTPVELDVLWAIHRFEYPFSFPDGGEDEGAFLSRLEAAALICSAPSAVEAAPPGTLMYKLVFDDFASTLFPRRTVPHARHLRRVGIHPDIRAQLELPGAGPRVPMGTLHRVVPSHSNDSDRAPGACRFHPGGVCHWPVR